MRLSAFGLIIVVSLSWGNACAASAVHLDFNHAVEMTLASSPTLQESQGQLRAANGAATAAEGARWPHLSASLAAARSNNPLTVFGYKLSQRDVTFADFGAAQFTGPGSLDVAPEALNYPGAYDNFNTSLQIEWQLYAGGRLSATVAEARAAIKAAKSGNDAAHQAVILEVLRAYEGVRAATAQLAVARRTRAAARSYLEMARKRYQQGTTIKSDVLTAQVGFDQSRLANRTASDQLASAREYLRILVGLPAGTEIAIGPPAKPDMPTAPLAVLQVQAAARNPTLLELRSHVTSRRAAVSSEKSTYLPRVSLVASRDWNDRTFGLSAPSYTIAGVLSWDIFDFGARRGSVMRARGNLDSAEARVRAYEQQLQVKLDRTWRSAREAADRVAVSRTAVEQAGEAQRILKLRFGQGLATITALLDGQTRLEQAESDLLYAHYQLSLSRATLLAELGELDLGRFGTGRNATNTTAVPAAGTGVHP
ncbi:MAG: TolC family protein [Gammaproteobacteria bacterium]